MRDFDRDWHCCRQHQDDDDLYNGAPGWERPSVESTPLGRSSAVANESLLLTVEEASRLLRVGRTTMFDLIGRGEIKSIRIGRRRLIARKSLESFVDDMSATK
jgi:excisionase family DNA binding protein